MIHQLRVMKLSYDEETILTNFNENKATRKKQNFFISLSFLLITIALLVTVGNTKNELKQVIWLDQQLKARMIILKNV